MSAEISDMQTDIPISTMSWVPTQLSDEQFSSWITNGLLLAVISSLFVAFSKHELKGNKRNLAIIAGAMATVMIFWALAAYYNSGVTSGYWILFAGLLVVAALFIYLTVVAAQN